MLKFNIQATKSGIKLHNKNWTVEEHRIAHELCCHHVRLALAHLDWLIENDPHVKHQLKKKSTKKSTKSTKKSHKK